MSMNRYIKLRRGDRQSVEQMMAQCEKALAEGNSVMMFPEGTRSQDGKLRPFKPGAFVLAQNGHAPLLPIIIDGSAQALPKRGFVLQGRHAIKIRILDEIPYPTFADQSVEELTDSIRNIFLAELGQKTGDGYRVSGVG
jgi:1-acyl-sn-glycerol-3-phosphate acyltransferase